MKLRNKKGFTIVELVIVIAVIAILAAVLIPTFAGLVEKANLSADEQAVRQMNTALAMYTAEHGEPKEIGTVKQALYDYGIDINNLSPVAMGYAFYWDPDENIIVLVGPDKATAEADWVLLAAGTGYGKAPTQPVTDLTTLKSAIAESSTSEPVLITLTQEITMTEQLCIGKGQSAILDLNGKSIKSSSVLDSLFRLADEGGSLTVKNGTLEGSCALVAKTGASVLFENVTIKCNIANDVAIYATGLSDVSLVDCYIDATGANYGIGTNSAQPDSDGTRFYISNTTIKGAHTGIFVSIYSDVVIENCEIQGTNFGAFFRGCNATIRNSKLYNTADGADDEHAAYKANGPAAPSADALFASGGDGTWANYIATGNYTCENVTFGENGANPQVFVHEPAGGKVTVSGVTTITHTCHISGTDTCNRTHN